MSFRAGLAFGTSLLLLIAACGGTTTGMADGGGGGGGDGGGDGGGSCTTALLPGDRACVPGTARANTPLELSVAATDGCLGCFTTFEPCQVEVSGTTITIAMRTKTCPPPGAQACPAICALPGTTCQLPALAAGTYEVTVSGEGVRGGLPPRQLVITNDATATSCKLPPPDQGEPLDGTKYSRSCSVDADCVLATAGNVCQPCRCPDIAIARSASAAYEADFRALVSQCAGQKGAIACAACAPATARCAVQPNALTGTCELKP